MGVFFSRFGAGQRSLLPLSSLFRIDSSGRVPVDPPLDSAAAFFFRCSSRARVEKYERPFSFPEKNFFRNDAFPLSFFLTLTPFSVPPSQREFYRVFRGQSFPRNGTIFSLAFPVYLWTSPRPSRAFSAWTLRFIPFFFSSRVRGPPRVFSRSVIC